MWLCRYDTSKGCEGKYRHCTNCILDKAKTEIKTMFPPRGKWMYDEGHEEEQIVCEVLAEVLQILDKYKIEGEYKE